MTRAIGESPWLAAFVLFFVPVLVLALTRALVAVPRALPADFAAGRFESAGPFDVERPLADFALRVDDRAGALVPARVFFVLLRDLEDFFARAAMTVASREWSMRFSHRKNWTHRYARVHHTRRHVSASHSAARTR